MRKKIGLIGAGHVGEELSREVITKELGDVILYDIVEGMPQGKALDQSEATPILGVSYIARGTNDINDLRGADIIAITAGVPRKPGMSREDLLKTNLNIMKDIAQKVKEIAPNAIVIVVTNPLDAMVYTFYKVSGFPRERVMGMAGVLDSTRFRSFIAMELGVSPADVQAMVLGSHGDLMVPLPRYANVAGIPISELLPKDKIDAIVTRTRKAGTEIVNLLKTGSAYYAPGISVARMIEAIVKDQKKIMPASCYLEGEYGIEGVFVGVPVLLGENGVQKIIELKLSDEELSLLKTSAEHVRKLEEEVDKLLGL